MQYIENLAREGRQGITEGPHSSTGAPAASQLPRHGGGTVAAAGV